MAQAKTKVQVDRPHPTCQLYVIKQLEIVGGEMHKGFSKINTTLTEITGDLKNIKTTVDKLDKVVGGNGIIGHKELVRRFGEHCDKHEVAGTKRWQVMSALAVGLFLAAFNCFLLVWVAKQQHSAQPHAAASEIEYVVGDI